VKQGIVMGCIIKPIFEVFFFLRVKDATHQAGKMVTSAASWLPRVLVAPVKLQKLAPQRLTASVSMSNVSLKPQSGLAHGV
jgi:hypothetical protein